MKDWLIAFIAATLAACCTVVTVYWVGSMIAGFVYG